MSHLLSAEQVKNRNEALLRNLRFKYKQLSNYSDEIIIAAYDDWFLGTETNNEDEFLDYIRDLIQD